VLNRLERTERRDSSALKTLYTNKQTKFSAPAVLSLRKRSYTAAAEKDARRPTALRGQPHYRDRSFV
jgi:hypothetical protein